MPYSSEKCQQSGIYTPDCLDKQIALSKGDTFPPCRSHPGRRILWTLIQATR